ncbi:MAG: prephenate dehydratase [Lachnospiraceae bacterium]|nr:prephenate dehydratase [Lachnospiraceae bacterium]
MAESEYLKGALGEINMQIMNLMERKNMLVQGNWPRGNSDEDVYSGASYVKYLDMMKNRREPVENPRIVYQGEPGAYSEQAAINFFGKGVHAVGLHSFEDTFVALDRGEADYAVLPIENSSTGAIRQVYDQLEKYNYFFVGETTVEINHALMALPGTKLEDIRTVYSHEQGLFQCEQFLGQHKNWRAVAQADTAGSARMVADLQDPTKAAICSERAAEIYGLEILHKKCNTKGNNTTRFIVISPEAELRENRDKICISLTTANSSGALHNVLAVFAVHNINLCRLESRPIPDRNWEYMFFIEFTGDLLDKGMDRVIHEISLMAGDLRVLGNFKANL